MIDTILEKFGLKYTDLDTPGHSGELKTLLEMESEIQKQSHLSVESIKKYISTMKDAIERELIDEPEFTYIFIFRVPNRKQIYLKARLKNYMLLDAYLNSSERMKEMMEDMVAGLSKKV